MALAAARFDSVAAANRLRPVLLHLNRHLRREVHKLGVSAGQISVLAAVRDQPGIGVAALAALEDMSAPSICAKVDRLEAAGLLTRRRGEGDRRRVGLHITPEGQGVLRAVRSRRTAWLASRLDALDPAQRASIAAAVDALGALVQP